MGPTVRYLSTLEGPRGGRVGGRAITTLRKLDSGRTGQGRAPPEPRQEVGSAWCGADSAVDRFGAASDVAPVVHVLDAVVELERIDAVDERHCAKQCLHEIVRGWLRKDDHIRGQHLSPGGASAR